MEWAFAGVALIAAVTAIVLWQQLRGARIRLAQAEHALDRDTRAERALAASQERARIAREMHDVVAHTLSVMVAQADGGRFTAAADPATAQRTLSTIGQVGRSALAEMRTLLGVLRGDDDEAARGPQPGVEDIEGLVMEARATGLDVSWVTTGTARSLPIGAGSALYRIAQESLTNVRTHAGPTVQVYVHLHWADDVTLTISDDGRGAAATSNGVGFGLVGMRERAAVFGGSLVAGPRAGGGYQVTARLPLPAATSIGDRPDHPADENLLEAT